MSQESPETVAGSAEEKRNRKTRVGVVVSDKMTKTIVVNVERRVPHPQFGKIVRRSKKFYVHDEDGAAKQGDKVLIEETIPLSKTKCWKLVQVLAH
ncbi:MAG: 30S ribosomal protein S17 [Verrucomicrobia bacterium]|nr:30S ribosomal protein S17 [Verrucomicrobiota bacterium]